jgi:tRNA (guanine-N7-)-methyltransferase
MSQNSEGSQSSGDQAGVKRTVRSFVLRGGRLTDGQKRALDEYWPRFGIDEGHGKLDFRGLFGNSNPVIFEIGFGNGEATWQMAKAHPQENFLGAEVHRPGVGRLLLKMEEHGLTNIRIACTDAVVFLRERIQDSSLAGIRIYFPDPWPKKRHHKRRIIQPEFIQLLVSRMRVGAVLHLATDWEPYSEHMLEIINQADGLKNLSPDGTFCEKPEWRPDTKYEKRGERLGHEVRDLLFEKKADC